MKLAVLRERRAHEKRVAATPDSVKKLLALGLDVVVESGAGAACSIPDSAYTAVGARVESSTAQTLEGAALVLKVQRPLLQGEGEMDELDLMAPGTLLIGMLAPYAHAAALQQYAQAQVTAVAMEMVPRISRAQAMDVLSSQSSLAGYRAVLDAAYQFNRALPMMMTAAGTVAPAKVMVLGAGVAGLQAIATAKRLGAIVSATDVRPAAKEQVESLGGKFVMVDSEEVRQAETAGGYAKEMSEDFKRQQAQLIADTIKKQDIVICTALIPGRKAPTLVNDEMVHSMRPGSIIVDLAVEQGGNCTLSRPGEIVDVNGVTIIGHHNVPSRIAADASTLYANNLVNFIKLLAGGDGRIAADRIQLNFADEIIKATVLTHEGQVVHPAFLESAGEK
jgi:NAD(P) transhydrogenase subunit alpha